jgi:hypothetical protein
VISIASTIRLPISPTLVYATTFSTTAGSFGPPQEAKARAEAQTNKVLNFMIN